MKLIVVILASLWKNGLLKKIVGSKSFVVLGVPSSPREFKCCCLPEVEEDNGYVLFVRIVGLLSSVADSEDLRVPLLKMLKNFYLFHL